MPSPPQDAVVRLKEDEASLADVVEILQGIGRMLQGLDAKLQKIIDLLAEDYE